MNLTARFIVKPGTRARLAGLDPEATPGFADKDAAREALEENVKRLAALQYRLYAENKRALLIVLQAMDTAGKDGVIRHVLTGINPQGCTVSNFKQPSAEELDHDFLWRIHREVPAKGDIGIFNRSHYEDVLIVRVHELVPESVWSRRFAQIATFEKLLAEGGTHILKFYLHISKDEQKRRLQERLDDPEKRWKFNPGDLKERKLWGAYMAAYEDALSKCSTADAPWFVIPSNKKWYRNLAVSQIIVETLEKLDMKFPEPAYDWRKIRIE